MDIESKHTRRGDSEKKYIELLDYGVPKDERVVANCVEQMSSSAKYTHAAMIATLLGWSLTANSMKSYPVQQS